jgi:glycosyltransferase involved in cell wall biosynthesis
MKFILAKPAEAPFIREDEKILKALGDLTIVPLHQNQGVVRYFIRILRLTVRIITCSKGTKVLIWFSDYHAAVAVFACRLRALESYIFVGGYDTICYPELRMGVFCQPFRAACAKYAFKHTSHIIANHDSLIRSSNTYYLPGGHPDGIKHFLPALRTPCSVVYNATSFTGIPNLDRQRKQQVLCVGVTPRPEDFLNKGYDLLLQVCRAMPQTRFIFVGIKNRWRDGLELSHPMKDLPNLEVIEWLPQPSLHILMEESAVYVQASISEGMPNALMEAMYYGCYPIGSNVAGIPTVIAGFGTILLHRSETELKAAVEEALRKNPDRRAISESIGLRFSPQRRAQQITQILKD